MVVFLLFWMDVIKVKVDNAMPLSIKKKKQTKHQPLPQEAPQSPHLIPPFLHILVPLFSKLQWMVWHAESLSWARARRLLQTMWESGSGPPYAFPSASFFLSAQWDAYLHPAFLLGLFWNSPQIVDRIKLFEPRGTSETSHLGLLGGSLIKPLRWQ